MHQLVHKFADDVEKTVHFSNKREAVCALADVAKDAVALNQNFSFYKSKEGEYEGMVCNDTTGSVHTLLPKGKSSAASGTWVGHEDKTSRGDKAAMHPNVIQFPSRVVGA